jgi:hypothetical protein
MKQTKKHPNHPEPPKERLVEGYSGIGCGTITFLFTILIIFIIYIT